MPVGKLVVNEHQVRDIAQAIVAEGALNQRLNGSVTRAEQETFIGFWTTCEALIRQSASTVGSPDEKFWATIASDVAPGLFPSSGPEIRPDWDKHMTSAFEQFCAGNGGTGLDEIGVTKMRVVLHELLEENEALLTPERFCVEHPD